MGTTSSGALTPETDIFLFRMTAGQLSQPSGRDSRPGALRLNFYSADLLEFVHGQKDGFEFFHGHQSETAFSELVTRHVNLVYCTALRLLGESHMAKDVAQVVFICLARKAPSVRAGDALPGWLYRTTCSAAANALRAEQRRGQREWEAVKRAEMNSDPQALWETLAPLLDEAMLQLNRTDQDAILMRLFQGKSLRDTGQALAMSEDAVQKRVSRSR